MRAKRRRVTWWSGALKALFLPPTGLTWPALAGFALMRTAAPNLGFAVLGLSFTALVVMAMPCVHRFLWRRLDRYPPLDSDAAPEDRSALVILDAGRLLEAREYGGDSIKPMTLERLRYGAWLHRAWLHRRWRIPVLLSGNGAGELMVDVLRDSFGVDDAWLEDESRNTYENAARSTEQLADHGIEHIYLVTHFWHMPRAVRVFRGVGLTVTPAPMGFSAPDGSELGWFSLIPRVSALDGSYWAIHELVGLGWYHLRYRRRLARK